MFIKGENCTKGQKPVPNPLGHKKTANDVKAPGRKRFVYRMVDGERKLVEVSPDYIGTTANDKKGIIHSEPFFHPGIGRTFSGKQEYRKYKAAHGIVEVGTEDIRSKKHRGMSARDIKAMYHPELV